MATYDNDLRLKEITTGDEDGTWGVSTNTNLALIADGFSLGTKQMAADANETFTMPDATADATRSLYLKITSAVSLTATREVTLGPNTVSKTWIIENATSGSQIITIKQGSGATVNVPNGSKVMVVTDGAGAGAAVFNANPTEVGGTVTSIDVSGGTTGLTTSGGPVTTSGTITLAGTLAVANGGTGVTSSTGTGSVVLSTNPTFAGLTTTADMNFGDNDKAIFGAGNDLEIYHNGSASYITDSGTGNLKLQGTNIEFLSATGEDYANFLENGAVRLYYDNALKLSTTATGIDVTGTATMDGLTVDGTTATIQDDSANLRFENSAGTRTGYIQNRADAFDIWDDQATPMIFGTNNAERMRIDSSGNVGIGESNPQELLHLTDTTPVFRMEGASRTYQQFVSGTSFFIRDVTAGLSRVTLDSSGNVGIGTTSPRTLLHVTGLTADDDPALGSSAAPVFISNTANSYGLNIGVNNAGAGWLQAQSNTASTAYNLLLNPLGGNVGIGTSLPAWGIQTGNFRGSASAPVFSGTSGDGFAFDYYNGPNPYPRHGSIAVIGAGTATADMSFWTDSGSAVAERLRIDSSGNVGIGNTAPQYQLDLNATGSNTLFGAGISASTASGPLNLSLSSWGQSGGRSGIITFTTGNTTNGAERMRIDASGKVGIGTTSPSELLHVSGASSPAIRVTATNTPVSVSLQADDATGFLTTVTNHPLVFRTNSTERMRIDASGNVGIGTTSPVAPLNIKKDGAVSGGGWSTLLQATDENSNKGVTLGFDEASQTSIILATSSAAASDMAFWTYSGSAWGERMRIDSSGNVGIGVVPSADNFFTTLEIGNTGNGLVGRGPADTHFMSGLIWDGASTQEYTVSSVAVGKYQITNGIHYWGTAPAGTAGTAATLQTNMILDASGNVGIGTTSPATNLDILDTSETILTIRASDSSGTRTAIRFQDGGTGTGTNGLFIGRSFGGNYISTNQAEPLIFTTNGTEAMRIDSSGNVGIGTASPVAKLQVHNSGTGGADHSYAYFTTGDTGSTSTDGLTVGYAASNIAVLVNREDTPLSIATGNSNITFSTNASERMRIDASGNVLVGKTASDLGATAGIELNGQYDVGYFTRSAEKALVVNRLSTDGTIAEFRKDGTTIGSIGSTAGSMYIEGNPATSKVGLTFFGSAIEPRDAGAASNGDVDLGASGSRFKDLYLLGTANVGSVNVDQNNAFTNTNITSANTNTDKGNFLRFMQVASGSIPAPDFFIGHAGDNSGDAVLRNASSSSMKFYTNNTEKARIDASGNLLVGRTSTITFSTNTTDGIVLSPSRIDISAASVCRISQLRDSTGTYDRFYNGASIVGSITGTTSATAYNTSSDQRLKENITDADDAGSKVDAIQVRQFDWKADGSHQDYGMVAQELMTVAPEAVHQPEDPEENDNI
jgi:hypothetical protein